MEGKGGRMLEARSSVALFELTQYEKQELGVRIQKKRKTKSTSTRRKEEEY
jgi:hypothetical protein